MYKQYSAFPRGDSRGSGSEPGLGSERPHEDGHQQQLDRADPAPQGVGPHEHPEHEALSLDRKSVV